MTSAVSYWHFFNSLESQMLGQIEKYVAERGQRERTIFTMAQDNLSLLKRDLLLQMQAPPTFDVRQEFDRLFERQADGAVRNRAATYSGKRQASVWVNKEVVLTDDLRRRIVTYYNMATSYGSAWLSRFNDTYLMAPENAMILFWPEVEIWGQNAPADFNMLNEEYFYVSDLQRNPNRTTAWTGVYYDANARDWMVSCIVPVDYEGRHIASVGHDIVLKQLMERTVNDRLPGSYNMLFREDGRLIVHPDFVDRIKTDNGSFSIANANDPHLQRIYQQVKTAPAGKVMLNNEQDGEYLAVTRIDEPGWFFVTVVSKSTITNPALETARFVLLLGLFSLIVELVILLLVFRREVITPLKGLTAATRRLAAGDRAFKLDAKRTDELGQLAGSFDQMVVALAQRDEQLDETNRKVLSRASELKTTANQQASGSHSQALAINDVNSAVSELTTTAGHIASLAGQVKERASQVSSDSQVIGHTSELAVAQSDKGNTAVSRTITASSEVATTYGELLILMDELKIKSVNMRHILDLLGAIATETHLLSLNAAIEAAGAGQYGERFGVVAQEVKNLASRSGAASKEVVDIIRQIQTTTDSVMEAARNGHAKASAMQVIVQEAQQVIVGMRNVSEQAQMQADIIRLTAQDVRELGLQIEVATHQQDDASRQVLASLHDLSLTASEHARSSKLVSSTALDLETVSRHLNVTLANDTRHNN